MLQKQGFFYSFYIELRLNRKLALFSGYVCLEFWLLFTDLRRA